MSVSTSVGRIHHMNFGSLYPRIPHTHAICYGLVIESDDGLVLVDTGFGTKDYTAPSLRMRLFTPWFGVPGRFEETAIHQISQMGFRREDVRHIILTHLHFDHAGGLPDFPSAQVHVHHDEFEAAHRPRGFAGFGYDQAQWSHGPRWVLHEDIDAEWFGFDCMQFVNGISPEILLIPLPGHSRGHCGVAIRDSGGWLFQCGAAASAFHQETDLHDRGKAAHCLDFVPRRLAHRIVGPHIRRLRKLISDHSAAVRVISAHDIYSYTELQSSNSR